MKRGKISSNSMAVEATRFAGTHIARMCQYIINTSCRGQTDVVLNRHVGYHLRSSKYHAAHSHSFPSDILHFPLVATSGLTLSQQEPVANKINIEPPSWEGAYHEWLSTTRLLPVAYISKHSHSIILIHRGDNKLHL
jgi:hypothetical protein